MHNMMQCFISDAASKRPKKHANDLPCSSPQSKKAGQHTTGTYWRLFFSSSNPSLRARIQKMLPSFSDLFRQEGDKDDANEFVGGTTIPPPPSSVSISAPQHQPHAVNNNMRANNASTPYNNSDHQYNHHLHHVRLTTSSNASNSQDHVLAPSIPYDKSSKIHGVYDELLSTQSNITNRQQHQNVMNSIHHFSPLKTITSAADVRSSISNVGSSNLTSTTQKPTTHVQPPLFNSTNNNNNSMINITSGMHGSSGITLQQHAHESSLLCGNGTTTNLHGYDNYPSLSAIHNRRRYVVDEHIDNNTETPVSIPNVNITNNASSYYNNNTSPISNMSLNTSQQLYFSNPTSIVQYSHPNPINTTKSSMHATSDEKNNIQTINYQSSTTSNFLPSYERNSPMQSDSLLNTKFNANVSSSSKISSSTHLYSKELSDAYVSPSSHYASFPAQYENFQHHEFSSSSVNSIKDSNLNNVNAFQFEESPNIQQYSKRKYEETNILPKNPKKRKESRENNLENPPSITVTNQHSHPSHSNDNLSKKSKSARLQKSPSGASSDNSLGSSTNNLSTATNNIISASPQSSIQFMNFSISEKSKIKFVNARHQQIGINDGAWTDKEHADFMRGLNECGKGRWREIAEYYVLTRTRTQVASHARKYLDSTPPNSNKKQ